MRCQYLECKYKIKHNIDCGKCGKIFCKYHRLPFEHLCNLQNIKNNYKKILTKNNPHIHHNKLKYYL